MIIPSLTAVQEYIKGVFEAVTIDTESSDPQAFFNSVYAAEAGYVWNNKDVEYPSMAFAISNVNVDEQYTTFRFTFYAGARQHEAIEPTTHDNWSNLFTAMETGFNTMQDTVGENENPFVSVSYPRNYTFAPLKMMDVLAVVTVDVEFIVENVAC